MNHLNEMYISSLCKKGLVVDKNHNLKKHIKDVLVKNVPSIEFITPARRYESQYIISKKVVSSIVDNSIKSSDDSCELLALSKM